jgi:phenylalanyl-tRNA synthetase alpha chain
MLGMTDPLSQIDEVARQAKAELAAVKNAASLEAYRIKFLGSNGLVKNLMKLIADAPKEQKRIVGARANEVKTGVENDFNACKESLPQDASSDRDYVDVTEPGRQPRIGNRHILMKVVDELTELFGRMGFSIATGPEVEDDFHNFVALNIPESHPARDPLDNFYLQELSHQGQLLLRTQTSTVQIRVMETQKPPIRVVVPGRVYRPDTTDATHLPMFHQLEALVVDREVTMADLKSTILQFAHAYFGRDTRVRFRPSFFPFTEPSAEVDVWFEDKQRWIELGGCGMVHPNVLTNCRIDPEHYSGWAFGLGIERIAMRKYGIQDIRSFVENDIRFLRQF